MKNSRLKAALAVTFALCIAIGFAVADNKNLKFGSGGQRSYLMLDTNLFTTFGSGTTNEAGGGTATAISNAAVSTVVWTDVTPTANPTSNGTLASITQHTIPNNALENTGDTITFTAAGVLLTGGDSTNRFSFVYGSSTCLDTGAQIVSNTTYRAMLRLARVGATTVFSDARLEWGPGGGAPFAFTNTTKFITETNAVDTVLKWQSTASKAGSHTNLFSQLGWLPTGK